MINIKNIGVVGGGNMGSGIAQKYATHGFKVTLIDLSEASINKSQATIEGVLSEGVKRGIFSDAQAQSILGNLRFSTSLNDLVNHEIIIEAIYEDLQAKQTLFNNLESIACKNTILATNTSSFLLKDISSRLNNPERFLGLHYFFHPAKNRLVEVIKGPHTTDDYFSAAFLLQESIKKIPISTVDSPGFIVNRFFVPWLNEAARILESGRYSIGTIDACAKQFFGVGMGPFELMNVTGIPIAFHALNSLCAHLGDFYSPSSMIGEHAKSGLSFPLQGELKGVFSSAEREHLPQGGKYCPEEMQEIGLRLLLTTVSIAEQMVFNEKIASIAEVDLGARVGLLWPKGPFELYHEHREELASVKANYPRIKLEIISRRETLDLGFITTEIKESVGIITFNRPDSLNALSEQLLASFEKAFDELLSQEALKGIILRGSKQAFMAGADLGFFQKNLREENIENILRFTEKSQKFFEKIDNAPLPIIALIEGLALGGGLELALCADYLLATKDAVMGFPETSIGIYPGLGGTQRTVHRVGSSIARYLILSGAQTKGEEARNLGLVDEICDQKDLLPRAITIINNVGEMHFNNRRRALEKYSSDIIKAFSMPFGNSCKTECVSERVAKALQKIERNAPIALKVCEELIALAEQVPLHEGLKHELLYLPQIFSTHDAKNGIYATRKKEKVIFEGR